MTALFAILVVEQWKTNSKHLPAILGFAITIGALIIFGADNLLIPTLIVLSFALLCLRPVLDKRDEKQEKEGTHG